MGGTRRLQGSRSLAARVPSQAVMSGPAAMVEGLVEDLAISPSQDLERQRVRGTGAVVEEVRDQVPAAWSGCGACTEPGLVVMPTVATKELPLRLTVEEEGVRQASGGEEGL